MTSFAIKRGASVTELPPGRPFVDEQGTQHPSNALELWTDQQRAAVGVYPINETTVPSDKVSTEAILVFANGAVTRQQTLIDKPSATVKAELKEYAAAARYAKEIAGIIVQGFQVQTDRASQAMINGAFNLVSAQPSSVVKFKTAAGFVQLDAAAMSAIAVAVGQHVQSAFATEAAVSADIDAGTITATSQIDAAFA